MRDGYLILARLNNPTINLRKPAAPILGSGLSDIWRIAADGSGRRQLTAYAGQNLKERDGDPAIVGIVGQS